jgi:hypothetical protein
MLEPNASITGSAYLRTAPEEMFESVSFIVWGKELDVQKNTSKAGIKIISNIFFILNDQ